MSLAKTLRMYSRSPMLASYFLIWFAQPLLRKPVCAGTAVAAAIAIYAVAGALTSVDQRLSRKADRGWRHHWKSYQTI